MYNTYAYVYIYIVYYITSLSLSASLSLYLYIYVYDSLQTILKLRSELISVLSHDVPWKVLDLGRRLIRMEAHTCVR